MDRLELNATADSNGDVVVRVHVGLPGTQVHVVVDAVPESTRAVFERATRILQAKNLTEQDIAAEVKAARAERRGR